MLFQQLFGLLGEIGLDDLHVVPYRINDAGIVVVFVPYLIALQAERIPAFHVITLRNVVLHIAPSNRPLVGILLKETHEVGKTDDFGKPVAIALIEGDPGRILEIALTDEIL